MRLRIFRVAVLPVATLLLFGCVRVPEGEPQTESKSIELEGAELARALI